MATFIELAEKALEELKVGNSRTIATDTYAHNNRLIHEFEAAITEAERQEPEQHFRYKFLDRAALDAWIATNTHPQPAIPESWREELELIRAVLDGFQPCMAKSDGLRAVHKLLAAAPKPGGA